MSAISSYNNSTTDRGPSRPTISVVSSHSLLLTHCVSLCAFAPALPWWSNVNTTAAFPLRGVQERYIVGARKYNDGGGGSGGMQRTKQYTPMRRWPINYIRTKILALYCSHELYDVRKTKIKPNKWNKLSAYFILKRTKSFNKRQPEYIRQRSCGYFDSFHVFFFCLSFFQKLITNWSNEM